MLDRVYHPPNDVWPENTEAAGTVTFGDTIAFLKRQFWLIAGTVAVAVIVAMAYVLMTPVGYVASAQVLIDPGKQQALWQSSGNVVDLTLDNAQVESQVEVLRSERIANSVIAALNLTKDSEFRGSATGSDDPGQHATLDKFESALTARRVGQSYVIEIMFRARDPAKAARITNGITAAYLKDQQQAKRDVANQANDWMEERITELGVQLNTAAAAVQQFRVSHGVIETANNGQPQLIDQLTQLEARAEAYRKVYETLLERMTENQQQASYPITDARVITSAIQPLVKSYPQTKLVLLLSIFIGLVVGLAIAVSRSMLDGSVHTAKQIRQSLGLPVLGSLPSHRLAANEKGAAEQIEVVDAPLSEFSEAMRHLKISVHNACRDKPGCCVGVLSLLPGEGASTVALNLAALFAEPGAKALLIDANFRDRQLTRRVAPDASWGLIEAVRDGNPEPIVFDPKTKAYLLPLAEGAPISASAELLGSSAMQELLPKLKQKFATILVDLPALSRTADARAIGPLLDGCIIVTAQGRTPMRALDDAVELLRADDINLIGAVLNRVSDGIPPLFGVYLDEVQKLDYVGYVGRLVHAVASR